MSKLKRKKFPKKAKLFVYGGFYKIIPIKEFVPTLKQILFPGFQVIFTNKIEETTLSYELIFTFDEIKGGYAIYRQSNFLKLK